MKDIRYRDHYIVETRPEPTDKQECDVCHTPFDLFGDGETYDRWEVLDAEGEIPDGLVCSDVCGMRLVDRLLA